MLTESGSFLINNLLFHSTPSFSTYTSYTPTNKPASSILNNISAENIYYIENLVNMNTIKTVSEGSTTGLVYPQTVLSSILQNNSGSLNESYSTLIANAIAVNDRELAFKYILLMIESVSIPFTNGTLALCKTPTINSSVNADGFLVGTSVTIPSGMMIFGSENYVNPNTNNADLVDNRLSIGSQLTWDNLVNDTSANLTRNSKISDDGSEIISYSLPLMNKTTRPINIYDIGIFGYIKIRSSYLKSTSNKCYIPILLDRFYKTDKQTVESATVYKPLEIIAASSTKTIEYRLEKGGFNSVPASS